MTTRLSASWVRWLSHRGLPPDHIARVLELEPGDVADVLAKDSRPPARPWTRRRRPHSYFRGIQGARARRMAELGHPAEAIAPALHLDLEAVRAFLAPRTPDPARHIKGILAHKVRLRHGLGRSAEAIADDLNIDPERVRAFLAPPPPPLPDPAEEAAWIARRTPRQGKTLSRPRSRAEQARLCAWDRFERDEPPPVAELPELPPVADPVVHLVEGKPPAIADPDGEWKHYQERWASGGSQGNAALTDDDARQMRVLRAEGLTRRELSEAFDVSMATVGRILAGRTYRDAQPLPDVEEPEIPPATTDAAPGRWKEPRRRGPRHRDD